MSNDPTTPTKVTDPQAFLDRELGGRPLSVLVFFRGSWCPFCQAYLREMNGDFLRAIRERGGELFGVTAHSEGAAAGAKRDWGLDYPVVSDPDNGLAQRFDVAITPKAETPLADAPGEYPTGMAQPAVIALDGKGQVRFRWAIDPSEMNLGGASDRPLPMDVWRVIDAALDGQKRTLEGDRRLDPDFLAAHYPAQHQTFQDWVASMSK